MEKRPYPQSKSLSRAAGDRRAQRVNRPALAGQKRSSASPNVSQKSAQVRAGSRTKVPPANAQSSMPSAARTSAGRNRGNHRSAGAGRRVVSPDQVSRDQLNSRRKTLRRQRGVNSLKGTWRFAAAGAAAVGLGWVMMQPLWLIRGPEQIRVQGTDRVNPQTLHTLLALEYPQSLLKVKPQQLETVLLESAPINKAHVSRRLFPPGLTVQVVERKPVALAELAVNSTSSAQEAATEPPEESTDSDSAAKQEAGSDDDTDGAANDQSEGTKAVSSNAETAGSTPIKGSKKKGEQVLMDEVGDWIPLERYSGKGQIIELPQLRVLGMRVEYRQAWKELYPTIVQSPVEVTEIDWRDPSNMKLKTDLGEAHIGPYTSQFVQQLEVLDKMRSLQQHEDAGQVDFIDLRSPTIPRLKMKS